MEYQRKILGLLFIIGGALFILTMSLAAALMFAIPIESFSPNDFAIPDFVRLISLTSSVFLLLLLGIPSVIIGVALLHNKQWAFDWILVVGCFFLIFFPVGTAIGIYAMVVFFGNREYRSHGTLAKHN